MPYRRSHSGQQQSSALHFLVLLSMLGGFLVMLEAMSWAANLRRIVEFKPGTPVMLQQEIAEASGSTVLGFLSIINAVVIELPSGRSEEALDYLLSRPEVEMIYVDSSIKAQGFTSGEGAEGALITSTTPPGEEVPWNLLQIQRDKVDPSIQGEGVEVAVVDTGIDLSHPALAGVVIGGFDARIENFVNPNPVADGESGDGESGDGTQASYRDCNGHGTHIAGIIAASTVGIAPRVKLHAVRVLDCNGGGFVSNLINGLDWVYSHPAISVINLSLGFYRTNLELYPLFHKVVKMLHDGRVVMVASAGNYWPDCIDNPAGQSLGVDGESGDGESGDGESGDGASRINEPEACNNRVKFPARYPETIAVAASDIWRGRWIP